MTAPTSQEALLACLNATNDRNVPQEHLIFDLPLPGSLPGYNSVFTVSAHPDGPYSGSAPYHYNRLELELLEVETEILLAEPTGNKVSDLVAILNQVHRTGLTALDVANWDEEIADWTQRGGVTVTVQAHPTSFAWRGSLEIQLGTGKLSIEDIIPKNDLDGLVLDALSASEAFPANTLNGLIHELRAPVVPPADGPWLKDVLITVSPVDGVYHPTRDEWDAAPQSFEVTIEGVYGSTGKLDPWYRTVWPSNPSQSWTEPHYAWLEEVFVPDGISVGQEGGWYIVFPEDEPADCKVVFRYTPTIAFVSEPDPFTYERPFEEGASVAFTARYRQGTDSEDVEIDPTVLTFR